MPGCSAINCSNSNSKIKGYRLFRFPANLTRCAIWEQNMQRKNWKPTGGSRLCEIHFESSQFENHRADGWRKLKPNAIPTLFNIPNPPPMNGPPHRKKPGGVKTEILKPARVELENLKNPSNRKDNHEQVPHSFHENELKCTKTSALKIQKNNQTNDIHQPKCEIEYLKNENERLRIENKKLVEQLNQNNTDHTKKIELLKIEFQRMYKHIKEMEMTQLSFLTEGQIKKVKKGRMMQWAKEDIIKEIENISNCKESLNDAPVFCKENNENTYSRKNICAENLLLNHTNFEPSKLLKEILSNNDHESQINNVAITNPCDLLLSSETSTEETDVTTTIMKKTKSSQKTKHCIICYKFFDYPLDFIYHLRLLHKPWALEMQKLIYCYRCSLWFDLIDEYKMHPCNQNPVRSVCNICFLDKPYSEHYKLHNTIYKGNNQLCCTLCENNPTEFTIHGLNKHRINEHDKVGIFECLKCDVAFDKMISIKRHVILKHNDETVEERRKATEIYKLSYNYASPKKYFKCKECNKILFTIKSVKLHRGTHEKKLCSVCGLCFPTSTRLKEHQNKHFKNITYDCQFCDKKFLTQKYLRRHLYIHINKKSFKCQICSQSFVQQTSLICHMATHTNENVFVCSVCGIKFDFQRKLTSHMKLHNADGTNPHKCSICNKHFSHKCNLLVHMRIHSEVKNGNNYIKTIAC